MNQLRKILSRNVRPTYGFCLQARHQSIAIDDLNRDKWKELDEREKEIRCKVASCYRLVDFFKWTHGIFNHITVRFDNGFFINPFGLLYEEITASSLVHIDLNGEIIDPGSSSYGINKAGWAIHSAIHGWRTNAKCIIHVHTPEAVAVSCSRHGLLPLSQEAIICGHIAYHDYGGIIVDEQESSRLVSSLGRTSCVLFLRNHGLLTCGRTIEEAFHYCFNAMAACKTQLCLFPFGKNDAVVFPSDEAMAKTKLIGNRPGGGVQHFGRSGSPSEADCGVGQLEFAAYMRKLDRLGLKTSYNLYSSMRSFSTTTSRCCGKHETTTGALFSGFHLFKDFLSVAEEKVLLNEVAPRLKKLRYEYDHWDNAIHGYRETEKSSWTKPSNEILEKVRNIMNETYSRDEAAVRLSFLQHTHVLDLAPDGYIKPHVDSVKFCGPVIGGLSLLTDCVMRFRCVTDEDDFYDFVLPRRSLYMMIGRARYNFKHEVLSNEAAMERKTDNNEPNVKRERRIAVIVRTEPQQVADDITDEPNAN